MLTVDCLVHPVRLLMTAAVINLRSCPCLGPPGIVNYEFGSRNNCI